MSTTTAPKRPHPLALLVAGGLLTTGLLGIIARALHGYTSHTIAEPFATLAFVVAVGASTAGGALCCWLMVRNLRAEVRRLHADNAQLRAERERHQALMQAVKEADAQGEVNAVLLRKLQRTLDEHIRNEDTQPIGQLRSINGGSVG